MADKKKQTKGGAVELAEKDLDEVQGGTDANISSNTDTDVPGRLKWSDVTLKRGFTSDLE